MPLWVVTGTFAHAQLLTLLPDSTLCVVMELDGSPTWEQISSGSMHVGYAENGSPFGFLQ